MPVPFGVGIATELRKNGEAAPAYQSLLLELAALNRALHQLQTLQPAQNELVQLNSIRATALSCERPLQEFLDKISKFQPVLGTFAMKDNRYRAFPRRMQWRMIYKDDIVELRSILGSHVATINLLLMTQTVRSITMAENERAEVACGLEKKIIAHRELLEEVKGKMELSVKQHSEMSSHLENQTTSPQRLETKAEILNNQVKDHNVALGEVRLLASTAEQKTTSILSATTDILTLITSGLSTLQAIATHLLKISKLCTRFTTEMRVAMGELLPRFRSLQNAISRIERALPMQVHLPTIRFTDTFGDTMALPYQLCQNWSTFKELLRVMYINRQGWFRIDAGQYLIMQARGGRLIKRRVWQDTVREGDHLSMCVALDDITAREGHCPFPSCHVSVDGAESRSGGKVCPECGRWSLTTLRPQISSESRLPLLEYEYVDQDQARQDLNEDAIAEDVEIYRQIYVQSISDSLDGLLFVSPPEDEAKMTPTRPEGILKPPTGKFPEDPAPTREEVVPLKYAKNDGIPPGARWTKISRKMVNPEALEMGKEPFEAREDFVIVLRVLTRAEIQNYTVLTQTIRARHEAANDDSDTALQDTFSEPEAGGLGVQVMETRKRNLLQEHPDTLMNTNISALNMEKPDS